MEVNIPYMDPMGYVPAVHAPPLVFETPRVHLHFAHLRAVDLCQRRMYHKPPRRRKHQKKCIDTVLRSHGGFSQKTSYSKIHQEISWNISRNLMELSQKMSKICMEILVLKYRDFSYSWPASTVQQPDAISIAKVPSSPCARMTSRVKRVKHHPIERIQVWLWDDVFFLNSDPYSPIPSICDIFTHM